MSNNSSKDEVHPAPWRLDVKTRAVADTGEWERVATVYAADGWQVLRVWDSDDEQISVLERIIGRMNAPETSCEHGTPLSKLCDACRAYLGSAEGRAELLAFAARSQKAEVPHIMAAIERADECTCPDLGYYSGCPVHSTGLNVEAVAPEIDCAEDCLRWGATPESCRCRQRRRASPKTPSPQPEDDTPEHLLKQGYRSGKLP